MAEPQFGISPTSPPLAWSNLGALSDSAEIRRGYAIRSAVAGTIKVTHVDGTTSTMQFTAGETRPCQVTHIWSTGTVTITATDVEVAHQAPGS